MPLQLTSTLTRSKELFTPIDSQKVKIYTCGPTPYNYVHIGNLRCYLFEDMVIRTIRALGYPVEHVMNVTDIDDKTIRDSQVSGKTLAEFTEFFTEAFKADCALLNMTPPNALVPISTLVPEMIEMIQTLLDRGIAYLAEDGSVYYSIEKFPTYGELAHLDHAHMKTSVRINNDEYDKESAVDFALWKAWDDSDGPNKWEAIFTVDSEQKVIHGRPGWHIECSACNLKYFGDQIDLHMGGVDNIFPHHQNEIAQSEACTGHTFSKYWLHCGHVLVDNKKMSKSLGNFYRLRDLFEKFPSVSQQKIARAFRLMCYQAKYSESFNFSLERLEAGIKTVDSIDETLKRLVRFAGSSELGMGEYRVRFVEKMSDDFDTASALAIFFESLTAMNRAISANKGTAQEFIGVLKYFDSFLGVIDFSILEVVISIPEEITVLLAARDDAKKAKNFSESDRIRTEIESKGYRVIDSKEGARAERI